MIGTVAKRPFEQLIAVMALAMLPWLSSTGRAQQPPGYLMWVIQNQGGSGIFYAPPQGGAMVHVATPPAFDGPISQLLPFMGNRQMLVNATTQALYLWSIETGSFNPLPVTFPPGWNGIASFRIGQEGELVVVPEIWSGGVDGIYRLLQTGAWTRLAATPINTGGRLGVDIDTGNYVVSGSGGVWRVDWLGNVTRMSMSNVQLLDQDVEDGAFLYWNGYNLNRMDRLGVESWTGLTWIPTYPSDVPHLAIVDESNPASPGEYVLVSRRARSLGLELARANRIGGAVTSLLLAGGGCTSIVMDRSRNLSTVRAGLQNQWDILVDFPLDNGYPYVCLIGLSGVRPGLQIDQRRIRLNMDALTQAALAGGVPGLSNTMGVLDSRGLARARIDVSSLGPGARGIPFWLVGIVLDPAAPNGIRRISPPVVVQIR